MSLASLSSRVSVTPPPGALGVAADPLNVGIVWDAENRLTEVKQGPATVASFVHDNLGRRRQLVAGGVTHTYVWDDDSVIEERVSTGQVLRHVEGPELDQHLAIQDGPAVTYYAADHLGSVVQETNSTGTATLTRKYDPWGNLLTGASISGWAYTGREWDAATGLAYYRARYYDPKVGRFVSEDPVDYQNGVSRYAYVLDQPTSLVDPSGMVPCSKECPPDVKQGKSDACRSARTVQNARIRQCIEQKCKESTIICDQSHEDCKGGSPGQTLTTKSMLLCPGNAMPPGACWKRVIIHEMWIHQCRKGGPEEPDDKVHEQKRAVTKKIITCP